MTQVLYFVKPDCRIRVEGWDGETLPRLLAALESLGYRRCGFLRWWLAGAVSWLLHGPAKEMTLEEAEKLP